MIVALVTVILVKGIQESASFNAGIVMLKLAIVLFVIGVGAFYVNPDNWRPFAPFGLTGISFFGNTLFGQTGPAGEPVGMLAGAAIVFFAYIGFDSVSTHAEEARNPSRDVPIGIIVSLVLCTILYIAVAAVLTGMVPYNQINIDAPVSDAFRQAGLPWAQLLISVGAVAGITSVLLVMMLSQPRIFLAMARDGLLPREFFGAVHERFRTPWKSTILTGIFVASMAAFLPLRILAELVNIGTLLAFVIVCAAVLIMRKTHPGGASSVPRAARPGRPDARHRELPDADVLAAAGELVPARGMAARRPGHLLRLQPQAQHARDPGGPRRSSNARARDGEGTVDGKSKVKVKVKRSNQD